MATSLTSPVQFIVAAEGYGALTIEALAVLGTAGASPASALLDPPTKNVLAGSAAAAQPAGPFGVFQPGSTQSADKANTSSVPWARWFDAMSRFAKSSLGFATGGPNGGPIIQITAWSIDETEVGFHGNGKIDATTDPVTFIPQITGNPRQGGSVGKITKFSGGRGYSSPPTVTFSGANGVGASGHAVLSGDSVDSIVVDNYGAGYGGITIDLSGGGGTGAQFFASVYPFAPGQYIVWNNPTNVLFNSFLFHSYEIDLITAINYDTGAWTLERADPVAPAGYAKLGSVMCLQDFGVTKGPQFYMLIPGQFTRAIGPEKPPQRWKFLWDNMCVVAVQARILGSAGVTTKNLSPNPPDTKDNVRPGLRTMAGNAYIGMVFTGPLTVGQNFDCRRVDAGQAYETIRTVWGKLAKPALTGGDGLGHHAVVARICYVSPDGMKVGLIDTITISRLQVTMGPDQPLLHQMPYHQTYPILAPDQLDWPPNHFVRAVGLTLGPNDDLPPGITFDASLEGVPFDPNGDIMGVIDVTDGSADTLRVTVQT